MSIRERKSFIFILGSGGTTWPDAIAEPNFPSTDLLTGETEEVSELWRPQAGDGGANVRLND